MPATSAAHLLLIEDDDAHVELIRRAFAPWEAHFSLSVANTLSAARAALAAGAAEYDLIISDWRLPDGEGLDLLAGARQLPLVLMTSYGNERVAVEAMRAGALDYIVKSDVSFADLPHVAQRAVRQWRVMREQQRMEQALRESEARYRLITQNTSDLIAIIDEQRCFRYVSPSVTTLLGYAPDELIGADALAALHPDDRPLSERYWREVMSQMRTTATFRYRHADGSWLWFECDLKAVLQDGAYSLIVVGRDITERRELEARLLQVQKMDAIGRLAGGVAHDFNNLLAVITGCTELARQALDDDHPATPELVEIQKATVRAAALTRQLLAFARRQIFEPRLVNLNTLILDMEKLLRRLIREDIVLRTLPSPDLWSVRADPGQIEQVIVNLAVNARDAMPHGGLLTIATANIISDEALARTHPTLDPGPYVQLVVSDTGIGMTDEVRRRAFEPFFTTKEAGAGTGLGLATCYGIVAQHQGVIDLTSAEGRGTTVTIYLPRAERSAATVAPAATATADSCGTETILLVEDDPAVRELTARVLRAHGYTVIEAADGDTAINVARSGGASVQLLLSDHVMPHMSGVRLAELLAGMFPHLKVLMMSGYADDGTSTRMADASGAPVLQKPFTPTMLVRQVRAALDS